MLNPADALERFLGSTLHGVFLNDLDADLDAGTVMAEPSEDGAIHVAIIKNDANGQPTDEIIAERFVVILTAREWTKIAT